MSKPEEPSSTMTSNFVEPMKQWHKSANELEIGPQRRKRMPAGRHLDAVKTAPEPPQLPLSISEQLQAQLKNSERSNSQSKSTEQSKPGLKGEIQVK